MTTSEVLHLPPSWVMANYRPTEQPPACLRATYDCPEDDDWAATAALFAAEHTHLDALRDDIASRGVRTPVELNPHDRLVHRGHHRLLLAVEAGVDWVPVVFARLPETTYWDPGTRRDEPLDEDDWDDDIPEPETVVYPVPDDVRTVAREPSPALT